LVGFVFVFFVLVQVEGFSGFGLWGMADVGGSSAKLFFNARSTSLDCVFVDRSLSSVVTDLLWSRLSLDEVVRLVLAWRMACTGPGCFLLGLACEGHGLSIRSRFVSFWGSWRSSDVGLVSEVSACSTS
jgi:hypothetical protein